MKDRLITLAGAALSALIVIMLLTPPPEPADRVSQPTTEDHGQYGLKGLFLWLQGAGVPVASWRNRYTALPATSGNLLVLSLPSRTPLQADESDALLEWVNTGNHLLVLAAYSDSPLWSEHGDWDSATQLLSTLGVSLDNLSESEEEDSERNEIDFSRAWKEIIQGRERREVALRPVLAHPLTEGVDSVRAAYYPGFDQPEWALSFSEDTGGAALRLLQEPYSGATALWQVPVGAGRVWLSSYADWLGNVSLGWDNNARLFGNLLTLALGSQGRVLFDDYHFGLSELYDPDAFFADARLHNTLWFFAAFWLIYVIGHSNRLAPPPRQARRIHAVDFVRATAGLFARRLSRQAVAHGLLRHFFDEVYARHRQPPQAQPPWALLEKSPAREEVRRLRGLAQRLDHGQAPDLRELSGLLHRLRNDQSSTLSLSKGDVLSLSKGRL